MATGSWRSLLFVPADSPRKLARAAGCGADAVVLDWEDAVADGEKPEARRATVEWLRAERRVPALVRINPPASPHFEADCAALAEALPDAVAMAKCRSAADARRLAEFLAERDPARRCAIVPMIESPAGVLQAAEIAASPRVAAVAFGAEDFSAEMGIARSAGEPELLYARCAIATACRAAGVEPVDSPFLEYRNLEGLREAAARAARLGFSGKLAIHPAQVEVLNEVFAPSEEELAEARRLLEAFDAAGAAVAGLGGRMVDEAVVRRARALLARVPR